MSAPAGPIAITDPRWFLPPKLDHTLPEGRGH